MTATTMLTAPTTHPAPPQSSTAKQLRRRGAVAGLSASVATFAVAAGARGVGVPISVSGKSIPLVGFAQVTLVASIIGIVVAVALARRADRPRSVFLNTTIGLTLLSFVPDVIADAHTSTKLTLALTHVVAAVIVIPALSSRLAD